MEGTDLVANAVRLALAASMAGIFSLSPSYAQDLRDDIAVQEKVIVTGSRIKRVDVEGPLPVTVIERGEIDASGEISVAEVLRSQTVNSFGSEKPRSGSAVGSQSQVSLRGLGANRTLVLVNGRRLANGGVGDTANLSMIPLAAVERIEILRDGASAVYGTDAMAGVVNIILRQDYEGMHLGWEIGRPEQSGGDTNVYRLTGGTSGAKGNVTFGFEVNQQDIVFNRQREFTSESLRVWGFPSTYLPALDPWDPRNPTGDWVDVGEFPDPRCPESLQSDPVFPWSVLNGSQCGYADWGVSATEAEYDTKNFFVDANYEVSERVEFFARGLASYNDTFGRWAPAALRLSMPQDAPQNPTNPENPTNAEGDPFGGQSVEVDTDGDEVPDTTIDGPFDIDFRYRNVPGGNRDTHFDDTLLDYVAGLRGTVDWLGGADWELAAQWSDQRSDGSWSGLVMLPPLESAIEDGSFDVFGVFGPYGADEIAIAEAASATGTFETRHRIAGADGQLVVDAMQLDHGPVSVALGFEYRDEDYDFSVDEQTASGNLVGGLGADNVSGARVVKSLFAEAVIPALPGLEINLAGRYDDYNDFGTTFNPKVSVALRPIDSLLLRASWGEGFRAPNMEQLYYPEFQSWTYSTDFYRCSLTDEDSDGDGRPDVDRNLLPPGHPCLTVWFQGVFGGNRNLEPETSRNWNVGFVWSPTSAVTLMADYYDIQIDDEIVFGPAANALLQELYLRQAGDTGDTVGKVTRGPFGRVQFVEDLHDENVSSTETTGLDIEANYAFGIGRFGDVSSTLRWTHVLEYVADFNNGEGSIDVVGNFGRPEDRGQLIVNWALGNFTAATVGNYISDQQNTNASGYEVSRASFTTWDVQLGYTTPWNGNVTIGARNVFDRDPPQGSVGGYDITQHEIYGRVPYVRIEQEF